MTGRESGRGNVTDTTETTVFVEKKKNQIYQQNFAPQRADLFFAGISVFCCSRVWFNSKRTRSKKL